MLEGVGWMEEALRKEDAMSVEEQAIARVVLGLLAFGWGDYDRAAPALARAHELCREVGNPFGTGMTLALTGVIVAVREDVAKGEDALRHTLEAFRERGDAWGMSFARFTLGRVLLLEERNEEARGILEQAVSDPSDRSARDSC